MSGNRKKAMNVVAFARAKKGAADPARVAEFSATARKLFRERSAGDVVARLLRQTPRDEWPRLAANEEIRNSGALDRLSRDIAAALEKDPAAVLAMSSLATTIAETLDADDYPPIVTAQMRAHAWKDRAQALSYVGHDTQALQAIDHAASLLEPFAAVAHDRAIVHLVKAIVLQHLKRWDESLALLVDCRRVFAGHKDAKQLLHCGMAEGGLHYRRGEYRKAYQCFAPLIAIALNAQFMDSLASIHNNVGLCLTELGDLSAATIHFSEAIRYFNDSGRQMEAMRTEAGIGLHLLRKGSVDLALFHLKSARDAFLNNDMPEEAGICGTLMMEAMLVGGHDYKARMIAHELTKQLGSSRISHQALDAITYAESAIEAHDNALAAVRLVHNFLESLRTNPKRAFVPPPG